MKLILEIEVGQETKDRDLTDITFEALKEFTKKFQECKTTQDLQNLFYLTSGVKGFYTG